MEDLACEVFKPFSPMQTGSVSMPILNYVYVLLDDFNHHAITDAKVDKLCFRSAGMLQTLHLLCPNSVKI